MVPEHLTGNILLALLWAIWCLLHSLFITHTFIRWLERWIPRYLPFHRLVYNCCSLLTFALVALYEKTLPHQVLYEFSNLAELGRIALFSVGVVLFMAGAKTYDLFQLAGLRQLATQKTHRVLNSTNRYKRSGISNATRHPWYLAAFFVVWFNSRTIDVNGLITNTIFSIYLVLGTLQEERKLVLEFGEEYRQYQKEVSMFLPFKWLKSRYTSTGARSCHHGSPPR